MAELDFNELQREIETIKKVNIETEQLEQTLKQQQAQAKQVVAPQPKPEKKPRAKARK